MKRFAKCCKCIADSFPAVRNSHYRLGESTAIHKAFFTMSEQDASIPHFILLVTFNAVAVGAFTASMPLLPMMLPDGSPVIFSAITLIAFASPFLILNPILTSERITADILSEVLICGACIGTIGNMLLSLTLLVAHRTATDAFLGKFVLSPSIAQICIPITMAISGIGASMSHLGIVRWIEDSLRSLAESVRQRVVGDRIAASELAIGLGAAVSPIMFYCVATTRQSVFVPFLIAGCLQMCLSIQMSTVLRSPTSGTPSRDEIASESTTREGSLWVSSERFANPAYGSIRENDETILKISETETLLDLQDDRDPGLGHALRFPWVWITLFLAVIASSSTSFLRPILAPRLLHELHEPQIAVAALFSLCTLTATIAEGRMILLVMDWLGIRNSVFVGLLICFCGFRILLEGSRTVFPVCLIVLGSSAALTLTVLDLSLTTHIPTNKASNSLNLLAGFAFSVGEVIGMLVAGLCYDGGEGFVEAASKWYNFMCIAYVLAFIPYGIMLICEHVFPSAARRVISYRVPL